MTASLSRAGSYTRPSSPPPPPPAWGCPTPARRLRFLRARRGELKAPPLHLEFWIEKPRIWILERAVCAFLIFKSLSRSLAMILDGGVACSLCFCSLTACVGSWNVDDSDGDPWEDWYCYVIGWKEFRPD